MRNAAAVVIVGTYSAWLSTVMLRLLGCTRGTWAPMGGGEEEEDIDTEVRCVGAHPRFWPLEPARVKPNLASI